MCRKEVQEKVSRLNSISESKFWVLNFRSFETRKKGIFPAVDTFFKLAYRFDKIFVGILYCV